jgi:hypothetical protein
VPSLSATGSLDEDRAVLGRSGPGSLDEERDAPTRSGVGARDDERTLSSAGLLDDDLTADGLSSRPPLEDGLIMPALSSVGPRDVDRIRAYRSECASLEEDRARPDLSVTAGCEGITASGLSRRGSSEKLSTQYGVAGMGSRRIIGLVYCPGGLVYCPGGLGRCRSTGSMAACWTGLGPLDNGGLGVCPTLAGSLPQFSGCAGKVPTGNVSTVRSGGD